MPDSICIIPSEALDTDALASALLFAELWQLLPLKSKSKSKLKSKSKSKYSQVPLERKQILLERSHQVALVNLKRRYSGYTLSCCLPLATKEELLWRQDIAHLLEFIAELQGQDPHEHFATLKRIFAGCRVDFTTTLTPAAAYVLVDCHLFPHKFGVDVLAHKVLAIWDHRPDTGSFSQAPLRCVEQATSCVALLLKLALDLGIFEQLSFACCLFALATLHLDQQQYGGLRPEEEPLWQKLNFRLKKGLQAGPKVTPKEHVRPEALEALSARILQKRNEPQLSLFEQANADVKFQDFLFGGGPFRVAVGVLPAPFSALQELCENNKLRSFMIECCKCQQVDFFVLLHRQSPKNPYRGISFCFICPPKFWDSEAVEFLLQELQKSLFNVICYSGGSSAVPDLVQLQQLDSSISRKGFMPIFTEVFSSLLEQQVVLANLKKK